MVHREQSSVPRRISHDNLKRYFGRYWVDVSEASAFHKREACLYAKHSDLVTVESSNRYRLTPEVFRQLSRLVRKYMIRTANDGHISAADQIAFFFMRAVENAAEIELAELSTEELWSEFRFNWCPTCHVEYRTVLVTTEGRIKEQPQTFVLSSKDQLEIHFEFESDPDEVPSLSLHLSGAPVCRLMNAAIIQNDVEPEGQQADRLLKEVFRLVRAKFGFQKLSEGRPKGGVGFQAAHLVSEGKSLFTVARELCEVDHQHNSACKDRIRKAVSTFWKNREAGIIETLNRGKNSHE